MTKLAAKPTKDRILGAAMAITHSEGARHLTIDAVTVKSGLSKGGVLYHFPSKTALLEGLISRSLSQIRNCLDIHLSALSGCPNPTLRALICLFRDVLEGTVSLPTALLAASAENPALLGPVRDEYKQFWQAVKTESSNPPEAFAIWSALEGLYHFDVFDLAPEGRSQLIDCLVRLETMASEMPSKETQNAI